MGFFDTDTEFEITPVGTYAVKLEDVSLDETKADPKISVRYKLSTGKTMWQNFTFKDTTKKWISWQIGVIGAWETAKTTCTDANNYSLVARACLDAIGKKVGSYYKAEVTHREYNNKTYADLKLEEEVTSAQATQMTREAKAKAENKPVNHAPTFNDLENLPF
jgi:hypothetical protein